MKATTPYLSQGELKALKAKIWGDDSHYQLYYQLPANSKNN